MATQDASKKYQLPKVCDGAMKVVFVYEVVRRFHRRSGSLFSYYHSLHIIELIATNLFLIELSKVLTNER